MFQLQLAFGSIMLVYFFVVCLVYCTYGLLNCPKGHQHYDTAEMNIHKFHGNLKPSTAFRAAIHSHIYYTDIRIFLLIVSFTGLSTDFYSTIIMRKIDNNYCWCARCKQRAFALHSKCNVQLCKGRIVWVFNIEPKQRDIKQRQRTKNTEREH